MFIKVTSVTTLAFKVKARGKEKVYMRAVLFILEKGVCHESDQ